MLYIRGYFSNLVKEFLGFSGVNFFHLVEAISII